MSAEKNTTEKIEVQAVQTEQTKDAADKKQEMLCALLEKGKNSHNQLTYADIADIRSFSALFYILPFSL